MTPRPLRVVIAGGGTGGHVFPGIAIARELVHRRPDTLVSFAGTSRGMEARIVPREGFELDTIRSAGLKGKSPAALVHGLSLLPASALDAWRLLTRRAPHVVVGVGGYSSGPVLLIAVVRRIPTLVLEQNAVPGLTNRLLSSFVSAAAVTYDSTLRFFRGNGFVSGNPVRPAFLTARAVDERTGESTARILIFGGSQGAHGINLAMVAAAPDLAREAGRLAITHQTGDRDLAMVREAYLAAGMPARVEPFIDAMDTEMKAADVVICRAGATTLAEITASGRPAILIPLPTATDDHQRRNAEAMAEAGAAEVIEQDGLSGPALAGRILALVGDRERRESMGRRARGLARPDAAARIVDRLLELAAGASRSPAAGSV